MQSHRTPDAAIESSDDLSALAWVHEELRKSLEAAHKSLRRFVKEAEAMTGADVDAIDPSVLRTARAQIHQGVGALELVGLPRAAMMLRACEAAVQRYIAKPQKLTNAIVDDLEHASFALLDYLNRALMGKPIAPLGMFPQYRAVLEAAGAERVHPADLWPFDWQWLELPAAGAAVEARAPDEATRGIFEQQMLAMLRGNVQAAATILGEICAGLALGAKEAQQITLWRLASAAFEALSQGALPNDVFTKRMAAALLTQLRAIDRGETTISERLAQDFVFFCAQARKPASAKATPRLDSVRSAYSLDRYAPFDYSASQLGKYDPAWVAQARKRVSAAKESWSAVAGGETHRLGGLGEQFTLLGESLRKLFASGGELLAGELQQANVHTQATGGTPAAALAMEVATAVLYIEASLEDAEFETLEQQERIRRLAERIGSVRKGADAQPLEGWMEDLYRRVSDRQTMGSVVQELRATLSDVEKSIDEFFRKPTERAVLVPVPQQMSSMRGVLSVLGMDQASAAILRMRDDVDHLAAEATDIAQAQTEGAFDKLAGNLGALGFLIDMLSVQPQMAKQLFVFDPVNGTLNAVMGRKKGALPAPEDAPQVEPQLIQQAQLLAFTASREDVPLEEVSRDLERLSRDAEAAAQPALVAAVQHAQEAIEQADDEETLASVRGELSDVLVDFVATASGSLGAPEFAPSASVPLTSKIAPAPVDAPAELGEDDEMREIFLEEAREVMQDARNACEQLASAPSDVSTMTVIRRAYHTLKGSSRMVGLKVFGEAAWSCEQLYNTRLASQDPADAKLLEFTRWSLDHLGAWIEDIAAKRDAARTADEMQNAVAVLEGKAPAAAPVAPAVVAAPVAQPEIPALPEVGLLADMPAPEVESISLVAGDLPTLAELDLPPVEAVPTVESPAASDELPAIELDLGAFDLPADSSDAPSHDTVIEPHVDTPVEFVAPEPIDSLNLDLDLGEAATPLAEANDAGAPSGFASLEAAPAEAAAPEEEQVKVVGPLRISIPLFNIFLTEADELSRRLTTELAEWALELHRPVGENAIALAHSLAGSSATVGFNDLSHLARSLEHALMRSHAIGEGTSEEAELFVAVAEEIRRLLHQFAAGFLKSPQQDLVDQLAAHEVSSGRRLEAATAAAEFDESAQGDIPAPTIELLGEQDMLRVADLPAAPPLAPIEKPVAAKASDEDARRGPPTTGFGALSDLGGLGQAELKPFEPLQVPQVSITTAVSHDEAASEDEEDLDAVDAIDEELFPIFEEEAQDLLPALATQVQEWTAEPNDKKVGAAVMRTLHTLKGGARLAGAMRLGEMLHRLETRVERLIGQDEVTLAEIEPLLSSSDALTHVFEKLQSGDRSAPAPVVRQQAAVAPTPTAPAAPLTPVASVPSFVAPVEPVAEVKKAAEPVAEPASEPVAPVAPEPVAQAAPEAIEEPVQPARTIDRAPAQPVVSAPIDWSRFAGTRAVRKVSADKPLASQASVRVRAPLLDRLVNQAGEVSITRSRIESEVTQIKSSLGDLTDNLERLRQQLRDIELQAETQMSSRMEQAKQQSQNFDPLEFDRFTRFQELTRMMAESVNDVATVQRALQRTLETTEDELVAQARLTRDMQDDLLRTRMVEFESMSDRLYRVVRQAAKETGKQVRLDIVGGSIEVDRGVLDRMTGSFEHLLRNCVTHGIETPEVRQAAGKDGTGNIVVSLSHEGNEVGVEFRDDGAGLNLARIREKGIAMGILDKDAQPGEAELANLIFQSGFSTAEKVTELAGRGVGMDVVRSDVNAMGGRIETATAAGQGTSFKLVLPLTTAVTQVVMVRIDQQTVAIPSTLIEIVRRASIAEVQAAYESGAFEFGEAFVPFFWLGALLHVSARSAEPPARTRQVLIIRSAQQRIALHVDEVLGNQEVVVKNLGPQLSRMPGLAGMTLLASGSVALIYNPVALATLYGGDARSAMHSPAAAASAPVRPVALASTVAQAPLILVVDDSLTVRRVTQRLLSREGYRVTLAKDGLDALERLAEETPSVVLSDIEMPRMDGFDLVRNIRADARWTSLPVIMITSRIAQKHRDYAAELGVDHYLGKPYSEEDLLGLINKYVSQDVAA